MLELFKCRHCQTKKPLKELLKCAKCIETPCYYCNKDCQSKHWPIHRKYCARMAPKNPFIGQDVEIEENSKNIDLMTIKKEDEYGLQDFSKLQEFKSDKTKDFFSMYEELKTIEENIIELRSTIISNAKSEESSISKNMIFQIETAKDLQNKIKTHKLYKVFLFVQTLDSLSKEPIPKYYTESELKKLEEITKLNKNLENEQFESKDLNESIFGESKQFPGLLKTYFDLESFIEQSSLELEDIVSDNEIINTFNDVRKDIKTLHKSSLEFLETKYQKSTKVNDQFQNSLRINKEKHNEMLPRIVDLYRIFDILTETDVNLLNAESIIKNKKEQPSFYENMINSSEKYKKLIFLEHFLRDLETQDLVKQKETFSTIIKILKQSPQQEIQSVELDEIEENFNEIIQEMESFEKSKQNTDFSQSVEEIEKYLIENKFVEKFNAKFKKSQQVVPEKKALPDKSLISVVKIPETKDPLIASVANIFSGIENSASIIDDSLSATVQFNNDDVDDNQKETESKSVFSILTQSAKDFVNTAINATFKTKKIVKLFGQMQKIDENEFISEEVPDSVKVLLKKFNAKLNQLSKLQFSDNERKSFTQTIIIKNSENINKAIEEKNRKNYFKILKDIIVWMTIGMALIGFIASNVRPQTTEQQDNLSLTVNSVLNENQISPINEVLKFPRLGIETEIVSAQDQPILLEDSFKTFFESLESKNVTDQYHNSIHVILDSMNIELGGENFRLKKVKEFIENEIPKIIEDDDSERLLNFLSTSYAYAFELSTNETVSQEQRNKGNELVKKFYNMIQNKIINNLSSQKSKDFVNENILFIRDKIVDFINENDLAQEKKFVKFKIMVDAVTEELIKQKTLLNQDFITFQTKFSRLLSDSKFETRSNNNYKDVTLNLALHSKEIVLTQLNQFNKEFFENENLNSKNVKILFENFFKVIDTEAKKISNNVDKRRIQETLLQIDTELQTQTDDVIRYLLFRIKNQLNIKFKANKLSSKNMLFEEPKKLLFDGRLFDALIQLRKNFSEIDFDDQELKTYEEFVVYISSILRYLLLIPIVSKFIESKRKINSLPKNAWVSFVSNLKKELDNKINQSGNKTFGIKGLKDIHQDLKNIKNQIDNRLDHSYERYTRIISSNNATVADIFLISHSIVSLLQGSYGLVLFSTLTSKLFGSTAMLVPFFQRNYNSDFPMTTNIDLQRSISGGLAVLSTKDERFYKFIIENLYAVDNMKDLRPKSFNPLATNIENFYGIISNTSQIILLYQTMIELGIENDLSRSFLYFLFVSNLIELGTVRYLRAITK